MDALTLPRRARREGGFILVMTLVILVVITLSSMAMMLGTKAGISAAGNIAFRQAATRVADVAVETAFQFVSTQIGTSAGALDNTNAANGYYSSYNEVLAACTTSGTTTFSPAAYDFANGNCAIKLTNPVSGYDLYYVIHRMATTANTACPAAGCMAPDVTLTSSSGTTPGGSTESGASVFGSSAGTVSNQIVYYRITVKVAGPKRNNRYIQAFVY
ncbi:MAG TPA: hypothetical protein VI279_08035 [Rhodocyclaceae bacterium]